MARSLCHYQLNTYVVVLIWVSSFASFTGIYLIKLFLDEETAEKLSFEIRWLRGEHLQKHIQANVSNNVPLDFLCPITQEIMLDPVVCSDGFTYERRAITEWLLTGKKTSPMTNNELLDVDFKTNTEIRSKIQKYLYNDV